VALESATRGLSSAVIEKYDFASGTSSRCTKLAHGGIRYFQQIFTFDGNPFENYELVKEALKERNYFLESAPYLNKEISLCVPHKSFLWTLFYYFPGICLYQWIYLWNLSKTKFEVGISGPSFKTSYQLK
jgi:glycerol-3-phosphate dehydrogenase